MHEVFKKYEVQGESKYIFLTPEPLKKKEWTFTSIKGRG